jgi:hypothetical protein
VSKNLREFMTLTFAVIALVVVLTRYTGFASAIRALSGGYRTVVGSFIAPVK